MGHGEREAAGEALRIRRAGAEDEAALLALLSQLHEEEPAIESTPALSAVLARIIGSPGRVLLLAEREGRPVGTLDLSIVENLTRDARPWAAVENLVVDRAYRRLGVGAAMLDAATAIARREGCFKLQLVSHQSRGAAHAVYEQAGFVAPVRGFRSYL